MKISASVKQIKLFKLFALKSGSVLVLLIWAILLLSLFNFWTDHLLDFWVSYYKNTTTNIPWYVSLLVTLSLNKWFWPLAITASVLTYFV
jgi:hypothetical protein